MKSLSRPDRLSLLCVLLVAAFLRLGAPGVLEYGHDEAMLSLLAQDFVSGGALPLTGIPSSVGIPNPPISVYVAALPYALSSSPQFALLFVAALNVVGVGLLWLIAYRYLGRWAALVAGLAYAVNPWAVLYSRKIWAQDFHTPFLLLALLLGLLGFRQGKRWAQVLCLPLFLFALQIHFAAWALLPLYFYLLWSGQRSAPPSLLAERGPGGEVSSSKWPGGGVKILLTLLLALLTLLPFAFGLSRTLQQDPNRLLNRSGQPLTLSPDALIYNLRLLTGLGVETALAPRQPADLLTQVGRIDALWWLLAGVAVLGLITLLRARHPLASLLLLWIFVPMLIFTPTWTPVYPHYFIASIPALCLLLGAAATSFSPSPLAGSWPGGVVSSPEGGVLAGRPGGELSSSPSLLGWGGGWGVGTSPSSWRLSGSILFLLIFLTQALWWHGAIRYVDVTFTPGGFKAPMHHLMDARAALAGEADVLVISDGFEVLYDQEAAIWPSMLWRTARCVRAIAADGVAVFPADRFAALTAPNAPPDPVANLYRRSDQTVFPLRPGEGAYTLAIFDAPPTWNGPELAAIPPAQFQGAASLVGYRLDPVRLYLEWRLPGPVTADYHYFGHFLDSRGEKLGQRDHTLWPGRHWCAADRLITWADITLPEGITTLRVGLYTLENGGFNNAPLLDAAGNPLGAWVDIPLPS